MEPILFLVHRIPFPPNKGDKIRSYHLLRHLAARYSVHLGTFVDTPDDLVHVPQLARLCASHRVEMLDPRSARLRSVSGFFTGEALTLPYYRNAALQAWVRETVARHKIRKAVVFSAAMMQYVRDMNELRVVLDMVDVDSAKWSQYATRHVWPSSLVYRREGRKLLSFERRAAVECAACVFVTPGEADLFRQGAPECGSKLHVIQNGVNTEHFRSDEACASPFPAGEQAIVFTGAMDYWPNVDGVAWFAREVLPLVQAERPEARFYIVGMNPAPTVAGLADLPGVVVTGRVDDVRPYVQHARVVVAPLRVARGIQNKILEAMAMGRPVVASAAAAAAVSAVPGREIESAVEVSEFAGKVVALFEPEAARRVGLAARARVLSDYSWDRNLMAFDRLLVSETPVSRSAGS